MKPTEIPQPVLRFIREQIDTVPHLEGLLLVWQSAPKSWTVDELASRLYVSAETARHIIADLARRHFIVVEGGTFVYDTTNEHAGLLPEVAATYRRELVQLTRLIHAKGSAAMQEFARAFKLKKDEH
jgi:predicted ArsR family transcriptional regulator